MTPRMQRITTGLIGVWLFVAVIAALPAAKAEEASMASLVAALAAAEVRDGKASPYLLPIIEELAQLQLRGGALGEAAALRRRALGIAIATFGCDSASAGEAMVALAMVDIDRRRYLDAEPLLIIARSVLAPRVTQDHPIMATILAALARVALARGDAAPATAWAREAVTLAHRNPHGRSAEPLRVLGAALTAEQQFAEAEQVLTEALAQDQKYHGPNGAQTARSLSRLGNLYLRQGRPTDALPLIETATAVDQARLGPTHPFIADDLYDLGLAYEALHRGDEARKSLRAAIRVLESGAGRDTLRVGYAESELSRIYREQGDSDAADAAFRDARRILNKAEAEERRRERQA